ncbi:hypothetical protein B7P43_G13190 [Cryptotermes secundus]|uniref:DDE Tnp4 domain-containing protein n=1 Tax=Cryptotermes secundus TaxID=105785 RepID=A0A2J7Q450_9NEOP|nr:hypothetical protein B7P43_G13190 [Cryptotermes secundus]
MYKNFTRMHLSDFELLINLIGPKICKVSLQYLFNISKQTISTIAPEACGALVEALKDFIKASEYLNSWEWLMSLKGCAISHCLGAIDGKHCDANYNFIFVDIGRQGRISDGVVFANSEFCKRITRNSLNLPQPAPLKGRRALPFSFIGDEAFPMSENLMKVYPGYHPKGSKERIFNYILSRARQVVENVFGIVSSTFCVLRNFCRLHLLLKTVKIII